MLYGVAINGRYRLAHWVGDDPLTANYQYYTFKDGHYVKKPAPAPRQPPEGDK